MHLKYLKGPLNTELAEVIPAKRVDGACLIEHKGMGLTKGDLFYYIVTQR